MLCSRIAVRDKKEKCLEAQKKHSLYGLPHSHLPPDEDDEDNHNDDEDDNNQDFIDPFPIDDSVSDGMDDDINGLRADMSASGENLVSILSVPINNTAFIVFYTAIVIIMTYISLWNFIKFVQLTDFLI
mgnify:FL=1